MKKQLSVISIFLLISMVGCIESGGDGSGTTVVPDLNIACPLAVCQTSGSAVVWAGLLSDTSINCETLLLTLTSLNSFDENFDAWGIANIFSTDGFLQAFVTEWYDINDAPVTQLPNGNYKLCGFYDKNGNGQLDLDEGFAEESLNIEAEDSPFLVDNWDFTD